MIIININGLNVSVGSGESETLNEVQKDLLDDWIDLKVKPFMIKTINKYISSYGLKHKAEKELGFYISNLDFKCAMARQGIDGGSNKLNMNYALSKKITKMNH